MKAVKRKFNYGSGLEFAWKALWKNPKIFVPYLAPIILGIGFNLWYTPQIMRSMQNPQLMFSSLFQSISLIAIVMIILNYTFKAWANYGLAEIVRGRRFKLNSWKKGMSYALKMFLLEFLLSLIAFTLALLFASILIGIGIISKGLAIALGIIAMIIFLFCYLAYAAYTLPFLFIGKCDVFETIEKTYKFFRKNTSHVLTMFFISLAILFVLSIIVQTPYMLLTGKMTMAPGNINFLATPSYSILTIVSALIMSIAESTIRLFYFYAYKHKAR